ncbi:hypothetical protein FRC15_006006 [Serendipita sp. 397]|nr:hypothetical protein FRC15_006006 [Serendipita sp. 397]KAG8771938.1 hypothetical protein FRC16_005774 [Serendipita sp. 398]
MEDMWDEPATVLSAPGRTQEPLFLQSDEESQPRPLERNRSTTTEKNRTSNANRDANSFVADLMDDLIDTNSADAHASGAQSSSRAKSVLKGSNGPKESENNKRGPNDASREENDMLDDKPKRRVIAKVDDERLIGERGFPALIKEAKKFKPKGKGHESEDLDRLLSIYQFWAHNMFPKTQFRDTVERVERVCRSRRMLINLGMWRDAGPIPKGVTVDPNKSEDSDDNEREEREVNTAREVPTTSRPPTSNQPSFQAQQDEQDDDLWDEFDDPPEEMERETSTRTVPQQQKPTSNAPDDDELEEWFNSEPAIPQKPVGSRGEDGMDIDEQPSRKITYPTPDNWDHDLFA